MIESMTSSSDKSISMEKKLLGRYKERWYQDAVARCLIARQTALSAESVKVTREPAADDE